MYKTLCYIKFACLHSSRRSGALEMPSVKESERRCCTRHRFLKLWLERASFMLEDNQLCLPEEHPPFIWNTTHPATGLLTDLNSTAFSYSRLTLANDQLDAQIFNTFITILYMYMFRAISCSSSGGQIVLIQHLVSSLSVSDRPVHRLRERVLSQPVHRTITYWEWRYQILY